MPGMRRPNEPQHIGWSRARYHLAELDVIAGHYDEAKTTFAALAEQAPEDRLANDCLDLALLLNEMVRSSSVALNETLSWSEAVIFSNDAASCRKNGVPRY